MGGGGRTVGEKIPKQQRVPGSSKDWVPVFALPFAKPLLDVLAQLSQRHEALVCVPVDKVEVRIGAREAPAFEVD